MNKLKHKRILLGVTGGIAAFKSAELVRLLRQEDAEVRVVMTRGAQAFITPLTIQALSGQPVAVDLLDPAAEAAMGHIELARWADLVLIAPATAHLMAKLAGGLADDLLSTLCLATTAPILLAPAMNQAMWRNSATSHNRAVLAARGIRFIGPADGAQACGDTGPGRLEDPASIVDTLCKQLGSGLLEGRTVVITAGPTREAIDPVRYISNHSSGKQGFALAEAAAEAGARVILVSGPVPLPTPPGVQRIDVVSAQEMFDAVMARVVGADLFIGVAAVADFRPEAASGIKIKKSGDQGLNIRLVQNPDILATVAALPNRPYTVGFAAETNDVIEHARQKLKRKRLDLIIANDVSDTSIGFNSEENRLVLISAQETLSLPQDSKREVSRQVIELLAARLAKG